MRVYVQVIGNEIEQHCTIQEPVEDVNSLNNALLRFGLKDSDIEWQQDSYPGKALVKCGNVIGGTKIVIVTKINNF